VVNIKNTGTKNTGTGDVFRRTYRWMKIQNLLLQAIKNGKLHIVSAECSLDSGKVLLLPEESPAAK
jgi:hypothetical protein